ncbi:hypothetical protein GCM10010245_59010 [Streptomyces spectabilis]|nr:hypothetical protein GCM10010245_59010 [Streptomyces spectabilis]
MRQAAGTHPATPGGGLLADGRPARLVGRGSAFACRTTGLLARSLGGAVVRRHCGWRAPWSEVSRDTSHPCFHPGGELIAQRGAGDCAHDGCLAADEMERAWPVVWRFDAFIPANEVRTESGAAL